jgi:Polyketide cyclase / dehydrase and lipid transport
MSLSASRRSWLLAGAGLFSLVSGGYLGLVTGAVPIDVGVGRRIRPLGPQIVEMAAPQELVFDLIAQPYLGRPTRSIAEKIQVLERGVDMVLAAHRTPIRGRLVATTVETVRFSQPDRVDFRLVRGPVPHVVESFELSSDDSGTRLIYHGELGTDLWAAGQRWGNVVAARWESVVSDSLATIKAEAERQAARSFIGKVR